MIKLEYNKIKVEIPESWDDITLGFYETFYAEIPETARDRAAFVARVCRMDEEVLLGWPVEIFNRITHYLGFLFEDNPTEPCPAVRVDGVNYIVPIEEELSLGAWVDADEAQKSGEAVLSNVLAIVCRPAGEAYTYKNNASRQAMFAALPVSRVLGVLAFFLHFKNEYERRTAAYTALVQAYDRLPPSTVNLLRRGGGIRLSQIWPAMKYLVLMRSLKGRLQRFSRSYNTGKIRTTPKRRKGS